MHPLIGRKATKMNGLGNVIVVLDLRGDDASGLDGAAIQAIGRATRGFDQLMLLTNPRTSGTDAFVRIYNNDGSEAGACGNGTRCVAWYLMHGTPRDELQLETSAGLLRCWRREEWRFAVDMGRPHFAWDQIPLREAVPDTNKIAFNVLPSGAPLIASTVNVGNPHAVFFVDDLHALDIATLGPKLEHDPLFPERANISFAKVMSPSHIVARVWERGAGLTLACGSAACAILVAASRRGVTDRTATVSLPGGDLALAWGADDHVVMEGPVEWEFDTLLDACLFADVVA